MKKSFAFFLSLLVSCGVSKKNQRIRPAFVIYDRYQGIVSTKNPYFSNIPIVKDITTTIGEYSFGLSLSDQQILNSIVSKYSNIEGENNYVYPAFNCGARIIWSKIDSTQGRLFIAVPPLYYFCIEKKKYITKLWLWYNEVDGRILGSGDDLLISAEPVQVIVKIINNKYKR